MPALVIHGTADDIALAPNATTIYTRRRSRDHFGGDIGAGPVLDSEFLPEAI